MAQILYVTEGEAAEKWCPKSMGISSGEFGDDLHVRSANRFVNYQGVEYPASGCHCLGSKCMWWVWVNSDDAYLGDRRRGFCGALMR